MARQRGRQAIVLDIRLPGMDGWHVLEDLKSDPATTDVPVIIVSIVDERTRGLSLGASDHLVKPVSREELLTSLARAGVAVDNSGVATDGFGR
jgi:CheY-like chemotaxis protein